MATRHASGEGFLYLRGTHNGSAAAPGKLDKNIRNVMNHSRPNPAIFPHLRILVEVQWLTFCPLFRIWH